jgi:flagellum-specific ATP synthase
VTTLASAFEAASRVQPLRIAGTVAAVRGLTVLVDELPVPVGSLVTVRPGLHAGVLTFGEVVGFTREHAVVMLLGQTTGIRAGDRVIGEEVTQTAPVGRHLLGRCVNGLGRPIDALGTVPDTVHMPISPEPIVALRRRRIDRALPSGVRAIDLMTTLGRGQRMGLFAGPGVGKSTLLGCIARNTAADVNVIALIGERGREVKDFIAHSLGEAGMARSVVVVATGDESPLLRIRAARLACTAAEYFRDRGLDVLLMMDSITRFAHAQRQVGLSVGEPPATKGYTPSVFSSMSLLLERAGAVESASQRPGEPANQQKQDDLGPGSPARPVAGSLSSSGSITGLYTILVEGDDMTEPIADAARGILDGHIILSRKLAHKAHYPAIDVLDSVSRVAEDVCTPEHNHARRQLARLLAIYREVEDLVQIGAYARGSNPEADVAIDFQRQINELLRQSKNDGTNFEQSRAAMIKLAKDAGDVLARLTKAKAR